MKNNEIDFKNKYKKIIGIFEFNFLNIPEKSKVQINFFEHFFIIKFLKVTIKLETIDKILHPIKKISNYYIINYTLIKDLFISESNIKLILNNLKDLSIITITLSKLETIGKLFNSKISKEGLKILIYKIKYSIIHEMRYLKELISTMIDLLEECSSNKKSSNPMIEEILFQSYIIGREFYDKYMFQLKKNIKIKETLNKNILDKIEDIKNNEPSHNYSEVNDFSLNNINIDTNNQTFDNSKNQTTVDNEQNGNSNNNTFDLMMNQFKTKTGKNISESIKLFFIILKKDFNEIDKNELFRQKTVSYQNNNHIQNAYFKQNCLFYQLNKISTLNPNYNNNNDFVEEFNENKSSKTNKIPKVSQNKIKKTKNNNGNNDINIDYIIQKCCKKHSFLPPNDSFNIFFNTTEIIQRKFFELFLNEFIGDIFDFKKDNDNLIKLDSLYEIFICIRRLKKIIFNESNYNLNL